MNKEHALIYVGVVLFVIFWGALGVYSYFQHLPVFSPQAMLEATWYHYKKDYLEPETLRALDKQRNNITTSEGQSYTLLRAVWIDDKATFDKAWQWTKDNLQREDDALFSWLFGERPDGSYGILVEQGGANTATDADVDMAIALLFAAERWNDQSYFGDAIVIIRDIWEHEVMTINGRPYLLANNVEKTDPKNTAVMNPSYLSPYAYRIFAQVDPEHDWLGVVDTSYEVLEAAIQSPLDRGRSAGLPPDWLEIDKRTGRIQAPTSVPGLTTNYSYDAIRTPWRIALDAAWFNEPRAYQVLHQLSFLSEQWQGEQSLASSYGHDGRVLGRDPSYAVYGGAIGYFMFADTQEADKIYKRTLESLYNSTTFTWHTPLSYYDANWVWFGIALYHGRIVDLYSSRDAAYEQADLSFSLLSRLQ